MQSLSPCEGQAQFTIGAQASYGDFLMQMGRRHKRPPREAITISGENVSVITSRINS